VAVSLLAAATPALAQGTLTGVTIYSTGSTGSFNGSNYWNTVPGDFAYNVFLTNSLGGSFLNTAGTLSAPLALGANTFYVYGDPGTPLSFFGINAFAGGSTSPLLSGFAAANGSGTVSSNAGLSTFGLAPVSTAGTPGTVIGGPLSTTIDGFQYTLTYFSFNTTGQFGDLVGRETVGPDGVNDYLGQFVITVAPVTVSVTPEPSTVALTASGLLGVLGMAVRRRRAAA
jgi:hypothetical protein